MHISSLQYLDALRKISETPAPQAQPTEMDEAEAFAGYMLALCRKMTKKNFRKFQRDVTESSSNRRCNLMHIDIYRCPFHIEVIILRAK